MCLEYCAYSLCNSSQVKESSLYTHHEGMLGEQRYSVTNLQARLQHCEKLLLIPCVCPSVRLFVRMEQLGSHWTDFDET